MSKPALWAVFILTLLNGVIAETASSPQMLVRDGIANGIMGWPGLVYQTARFEPLCGNLGTDDRYKDVIDMSGRCTAAMDAFGNDTSTTLGIYDSTGTVIEDGILANGYETCLCFALSQTGDTGFKGGFCWWVDGAGRGDGWWSLRYDGILAGSYRPNVAKTLPQCKDVKVQDLKASWSATAVQPSATGVSKTSAPTNSGGPAESSTQTATATDTSTTETTATNSSSGGSGSGVGGKGLSRSDIIALGVGLGVGIPTVLIALATLCYMCTR